MFGISKYLAILRSSILRQLEHRMANFFWFMVGIVPATINYTSMTVIYGNRDNINGFEKDRLLAYFLTYAFLWYIVGGTANYFMTSEIKDGKLNQWLAKPLHPIVQYIFWEQGWKIGSLIVVIPSFVFISLILNVHYPFESIVHFFIVVAALLGGAAIFTLWDMIIGMTAFFIDNTFPINRLNRATYFILSGQLAPLVLFPAVFQKVNDFLFYRYTFGFPLELIFNFHNIDIKVMFLRQFLWLIIILIIFNIVYKIGIKKYEAYGN